MDLGRLFPDAAWHWLECNGARLHRGQRVRDLIADATGGWKVEGVAFDRVVLAVGATDAVKLVGGAIGNGAFSTGEDVAAAEAWSNAAEALRFEPIATVYLSGATALAAPMLALRASPEAPAQFAFDRGQLCGAAGSLALVVSACDQDRDVLQQRVLNQARKELRQPNLAVMQTVVEKRATFACTPGLDRPLMYVAAGLLACGDYVDGPYPATLEGAVRSGVAAAAINVAP
jgi:hypothetical protein